MKERKVSSKREEDTPIMINKAAELILEREGGNIIGMTKINITKLKYGRYYYVCKKQPTGAAFFIIEKHKNSKYMKEIYIKKNVEVNDISYFERLRSTSVMTDDSAILIDSDYKPVNHQETIYECDSRISVFFKKRAE